MEWEGAGVVVGWSKGNCPGWLPSAAYEYIPIYVCILFFASVHFSDSYKMHKMQKMQPDTYVRSVDVRRSLVVVREFRQRRLHSFFVCYSIYVRKPDAFLNSPDGADDFACNEISAIEMISFESRPWCGRIPKCPTTSICTVHLFKYNCFFFGFVPTEKQPTKKNNKKKRHPLILLHWPIRKAIVRHIFAPSLSRQR